MPVALFIVVVGAAAGFLATRFMRVQTDVPTTVVIGMAGAVIGWLSLRLLVSLTGVVFWVVAAVAGAMALIWVIQKVWPGRR